MEKNFTDQNIIASWNQNSQAWITTLDNGYIESRKVATNAAILEAVLRHHPRKVLDMGCGEGWLCRQLDDQGVETLGIDCAETLIANAADKRRLRFVCASYEQLLEGEPVVTEKFEVIVFNYALFGEAHTPAILQLVQHWLEPGGRVIIQTLDPQHPAFADFTEARWIQEDWAAMQTVYPSAMPWFYRPLPDWLDLFEQLGYSLENTTPVAHPEHKSRISVIFTLVKSK